MMRMLVVCCFATNTHISHVLTSFLFHTCVRFHIPRSLSRYLAHDLFACFLLWHIFSGFTCMRCGSVRISIAYLPLDIAIGPIHSNFLFLSLSPAGYCCQINAFFFSYITFLFIFSAFIVLHITRILCNKCVHRCTRYAK